MLVEERSISHWNRPVPRYTSYPTAPQFYPIGVDIYQEHVKRLYISERPFSLYIHIPFCKTMCLFCACSVVLNRNPQRQRAYLESLLKEISLLPHCAKKRVPQIHLGGGTPTSLSEEEFALLLQALKERFLLDGEISIEIDPRTVYGDGGKKLTFLRELGFNRVSFGVQDLDPLVQEAVKRRQSEEMTEVTYRKARELGFEGINLDLIYGLPHQTADRFAKTVEKISLWRPDRIALFSYAQVPWLKPHQKAIPHEALPSAEEKFRIYAEAREAFIQAGYVAIGMDHFALEGDPLAHAYREKKMIRNFQGYSLPLAEEMLGLGITSIGFLEGTYFQNVKEIKTYEERIQQGSFPVERGFILTNEDRLRHWVIQSLMCHFELDKREFQRRFDCAFDSHFQKQREKIERLKKEGLLEETDDKLLPTPLGCLFIRLIAAVFDAYSTQNGYSRAV